MRAANVIGVVGWLALAPAAGAQAIGAEGQLDEAEVQSSSAPTAPSSCVACHSDPELFDEESISWVSAQAAGVHAGAGISCHDCHGGNPDPALAGDLDAAMSEDWEANPYRGSPAVGDIPGACGGCHADAEYMKRFRPDIATDQLDKYSTSQHGQALAAGDTEVATCVDCHGVHGILPLEDDDSPMHPTRVAETCGSCHSDAEKMAPYSTPYGAPVPIDQHALWRGSVHAAALLERGDLSAPTCNDCHGSHGATPPGVESLAFVCGECHIREAQIFPQSAKFDALEEHNAFLEDADGCSDCHVEPDAAADVTTVHGFLQCVACHGQHDIVRSSVAMLSPLPETPCAFCHDGSSAVETRLLTGGRREIFSETLETLLSDAENLGILGDERFDWLVDRSLEIEGHLGEVEGARSFPDLMQRLRIGKTRTTFQDPDTGLTTSRTVTRCIRCHSDEPVLGTRDGLEFGAAYLARMHEAASEAGQAARLILTARRGGVDTREAREHAGAVVEALIDSQVLFHSFSLEEGGDLDLAFATALDEARTARSHGEAALEELARRRRGLAGSLLLIVLALTAVAIKIRSLP
jgi:hypothetical protein